MDLGHLRGKGNAGEREFLQIAYRFCCIPMFPSLVDLLRR